MKFWQLISFDGELVSSFHKNDKEGIQEIIDELNNLKDNYDSFSELDIDSLIENMQKENPETHNWEAKDNIFISIEFHDMFEEM
jgi:hypothetical protein